MSSIRNEHLTIPVVDNTVVDGVLELEDTSLGLSFVADVGLFAVHTDHDSLMLGSADDGREAAPGGIITSNAGFALS